MDRHNGTDCAHSSLRILVPSMRRRIVHVADVVNRHHLVRFVRSRRKGSGARNWGAGHKPRIFHAIMDLLKNPSHEYSRG